MSRFDRVASIFTILLVFVSVAAGTDPAAKSRGIYAYQSFSGARENVNLATGNLNVTIPLLQLSGRNGHDLNISIGYDSQRWSVVCRHDPYGHCIQHWDWVPAPRSLGTPPMWSEIEFDLPFLSWTNDPTPAITSFDPSCERNYVVTMPDGSTHLFPDVVAQCYHRTTPNGALVRYPQGEHPLGESDGPEFMLLDGNTKIVKTKEGATITPTTMRQSTFESQPTVIDSNGNVITYTGSVPGIASIRDTLGRQVTVQFESQNPADTKYVEYLDSNGVRRRISLNYVQRELTPTFSVPADVNVECSVTYPACTALLLSSITFPNGLSYTFEYNNFGELTKVVYPTGGYTRYEYGSFVHLVIGKPELPPVTSLDGPEEIREVIAKHVCSKATGACSTDEEETTLYTPSVDSGKSNNESVDVLDPQQNLTHYEFSFYKSDDFQCANGCTGPFDFAPRELVKRIYQGQSTLFRTIETCYDALGSCARLTTNRSLPVRVSTTLVDAGQMTKVEWDYDSYTPTGSTVNYKIDNVVEERTYDYGLGSPGSLLQKKTYSWLRLNPVNNQDYTSSEIHILNQKTSEAVYDGAGNVAGQTSFEYDNFTEGLIGTGAVQLNSSAARGNLTAVKRWRNADGKWLLTRKQYDDAGNVRKVTDPQLHSTFFSFDDSWANTACAQSGKTAAYNTAIQNALGHTILQTYNSCSGTLASTTDPNKQTTNFAYDPMNRLIQTDLPPDPAGQRGQVQKIFNDPALPSAVTIKTKLDANRSKTTTIIIDGLGRTSQTQLLE
jgi:hypothetical protein